MVSSIGSGSSLAMGRPDPRDLFNKIDADGSGGISQSELQVFSEDMEKKAGKSLEVGDSSFSTYDSNGDGILSTAELDSLLESNRPAQPEGSGQGMGPPPPPPEQASEAYSANSGNELSSLISGLHGLLEKLTLLSESDGSESSESAEVSAAGGKDAGGFFSRVDTDGNGGVSPSELQALADDMKNRVGIGIDTADEAFASYDSDGDGALGEEELKTVMDANRPEPPGGMRAQGPFPPSVDRSASSASGSLGEQITALKSLLDRLSRSDGSSAGEGSVLSVTS